MNKISRTTLGSLIEFQRGFDLPQASFLPGDVPVISSNGILGFHNEFKVKGPGITIGRSGTVGLPHYIESNFFPHNTSLYVKDFKGNNPKYIFYLLKTFGLNVRKSGSGVPTMNRNHLHPLAVSAHLEPKDQQKIAAVLSALDTKIEVNNRINAELERMAKTLYDYWFVQFDFPDQNGQPYKSSGGGMTLNAELKRSIPDGWEVKRLKEFAKTSSGATPLSTNSEYYENGEIPWINSGELNEPYIMTAQNYITEKALRESSAKMFPAKTLLVAMYGATAGKASLLLIPACTNQAVCAILTNSEMFTNYLKFGFADLYEYLVNVSSGSARDNLSQDGIKDLKFIIPNKLILTKFDKIISPMIEQIALNIRQNQHLSTLRDWLLPMLMNGQVTVKDSDDE